jgi:hypothetical protein
MNGPIYCVYGIMKEQKKLCFVVNYVPVNDDYGDDNDKCF